MTKRETLVEMLKRYADVQDTIFATTSDGTGEPDYVAVMPLAWNRSFRELDRCLRLLRDVRPRLYCQLRDRYINPDVVTRELPVKNGRVLYPAFHEHDAGQPVIGSKTARVRVRRWPESVNEAAVKEGLDWLMREFNEVPYLPSEMAS